MAEAQRIKIEADAKAKFIDGLVEAVGEGGSETVVTETDSYGG